MALKSKAEKDRRRRQEIDLLANSFVEQAGIRRPPVDPLDWCRDTERILVHEVHLRGECDGLLLFRRGKFHLFYHPDRARQRFTLGHEAAHYLIDEHHAAIRSRAAEHACIADFVSENQMEREADLFAAGLLMPRSLFAPLCPDPSFADIAKVASTFDVSLTSAALRTIVFSDVRTAVVVTVHGTIKWGVCSDDMFFSGVHSVKKGEPPPRRSKTAAVCAAPDRYPAEPLEGGKCFASEWFRTAHGDAELWEEVRPVPAYGQVMTLLTFCDD